MSIRIMADFHFFKILHGFFFFNIFIMTMCYLHNQKKYYFVKDEEFFTVR